MPATHYIVQSFYRQGKKLVADQPRKMTSADAAIASAQRVAGKKAGVVAYSVSYDPEADVTDEAKVLWRAGDLPAELAEG